MNVGLLGAGHIARALAEGWSRPGAGPGRPEGLRFFDVAPDRAAALAADTGGVAADDAAGLVEASDLVILAVRPPQVEDALAGIAPLLGHRALVSVAAGVPLERLRALLPPGASRRSRDAQRRRRPGAGRLPLRAGYARRGRTSRSRELFEAAGTVVEVDRGASTMWPRRSRAACRASSPAWPRRSRRPGSSGGLAPSTALQVSLGGLARRGGPGRRRGRSRGGGRRRGDAGRHDGRRHRGARRARYRRDDRGGREGRPPLKATRAGLRIHD